MAINEFTITGYYITCDKCGEAMNDGNQLVYYENMDALEYFGLSSYLVDDGKHFCDYCTREDKGVRRLLTEEEATEGY